MIIFYNDYYDNNFLQWFENDLLNNHLLSNIKIYNNVSFLQYSIKVLFKKSKAFWWFSSQHNAPYASTKYIFLYDT